MKFLITLNKPKIIECVSVDVHYLLSQQQDINRVPEITSEEAFIIHKLCDVIISDTFVILKHLIEDFKDENNDVKITINSTSILQEHVLPIELEKHIIRSTTKAWLDYVGVNSSIDADKSRDELKSISLKSDKLINRKNNL